MSFVDALEIDVLDHLVGNATWTSPAPVYAALSTTTPTDAGGNVTEPSGNAYARVQVPASSWASAASGSIATSADVSFPQASGGNWGTITHVVLYDALTTGNPLVVAALSSSVAVNNGNTFTITSGNLTIDLD